MQQSEQQDEIENIRSGDGYAFSFYDEFGCHVRKDGRKMIYNICCSMTVSNPGVRTEVMSQIKLTAIIDSHRYVLNLFDCETSQWKSVYTIPGDTVQQLSWNGFLPEYGRFPDCPGMILIDEEDQSVDFEFSYINKAGKCVIASCMVAQILKRNPRLIAAN